MNQYNDEYESYYAKIKNKGPKVYKYNSDESSNSSIQYGEIYGSASRKNNSINIGQKIIRRLIVDLVGTCILFSTVLFCKNINIPEAKEVYNYGKEMLDTDIEDMQIEAFNIDDVQSGIEKFFDDIKENSAIKDEIQSEDDYKNLIRYINFNRSN